MTERAGELFSRRGDDADTDCAELRSLPMQAIDNLPPTFQEIVKLPHVDRRSNVEAARRLHISLQNAAIRLCRAHRLVRGRLTSHR